MILFGFCFQTYSFEENIAVLVLILHEEKNYYILPVVSNDHLLIGDED